MSWLKDFARALAELLVQVAIDVALSGPNIAKFKMALQAVKSESMINAPIKGVADEELAKKVEESRMADVPLPEHPDA